MWLGRTSLRRRLLSGALSEGEEPALGESGEGVLQAYGAAGVKIWRMSTS